VPLEYSIERATWAITSGLDAVMVGWPVLLKIAHLLTCRLLGVVPVPLHNAPQVQ
jgi:hypothetical protein